MMIFQALRCLKFRKIEVFTIFLLFVNLFYLVRIFVCKFYLHCYFGLFLYLLNSGAILQLFYKITIPRNENLRFCLIIEKYANLKPTCDMRNRFFIFLYKKYKANIKFSIKL